MINIALFTVLFLFVQASLLIELNYSTFANSYLIILPNKKSVLYLQLRNRYFGNVRFGTKIEAYEIF